MPTVSVSPASRLITAPEGLPRLTLGWEQIRWATKYLTHPNGLRAGKRWEYVDSQLRFVLWWYAIHEDGSWVYNRGVRRLVKGSGKSPFAAVMALGELVAPVRLVDFDPQMPGGVRGRPVSMPLVQIAATAESQTENTMRMVRALAPKRSRLVREFNLDPGKTLYYKQPEGSLQVMTSSTQSAEGGEATFIVGDETEHWTPSTGGPEFYNTLADNLAKSGSRMLETSNAWKPDAGTVAEASYMAWVAQEEGKTRGRGRILYDARVAPPDTDLADEASLRRALDFVYGDCWWVDRSFIIDRIWDVSTSPDDSKRKYLNWPTEARDAWMRAPDWDACCDATLVLSDGDQVALAGDLSKSGDATALVVCRISDGALFVWDVWEPPDDPRAADGWEVPRVELDAAVERAFSRLDVVAFYAEPGPLLSYVDLWGERYRDRVCAAASQKNPIRFDMRSTQGTARAAVLRRFTEECEATHAAAVARDLRHDGDGRLRRHMLNARRRPNNYGVSIGKESRMSAQKVDAAVTAVIARIARKDYLALPDSRKRTGTGDRRVVILA